MSVSRLLRLLVCVSGVVAASATQAVVSVGNAANWALTTGAFGGAFDGEARLLFSNNQGNFICSGSLLQGGQYVLTAAHCADDFSSMTIDFQHGAVTRTAAQAIVHSGWSDGQFLNGADIALIKLNQPVTTIRGFGLSTANAVGNTMLLMGYGLVGSGNGGTTGFDWGQAHFGANRFDLAVTGTYGLTYGFDFDNGTRQQDTFCSSEGVCDWGLSSLEAMIAGGDSGGGSFVWSGSEWLLAGVHSFTRSYGQFSCPFSSATPCGDLDSVLFNGTFGETAGDTAVVSHLGWINSLLTGPVSGVSSAVATVGALQGLDQQVPEPGTWALGLVAMMAGGWSLRRGRSPR